MSTPQQPPPEPQQDAAADAAAVTAIATALVGAASALAALALLGGSALVTWKVSRGAMRAALEVVMAMPPEQTGVAGSATMNASRTNLIRRAQFALAAARRLTKDMIEARSRGESTLKALAAGMARERRYFGMHRDAIWQRAQAAMQVDMAAWTWGDMLGWNTVLDSRTSADCRAANGANFRASSVPLIGYPGSVHPHCRCYAGPPRIGARMLPSTSPEPAMAGV
jgi:hypothetical protein